MEIKELTKEINKLDRIDREKLDELLTELNYSTLDYIYRRLWANHVKEDIISRIKDNFAYLKYSDTLLKAIMIVTGHIGIILTPLFTIASKIKSL